MIVRYGSTKIILFFTIFILVTLITNIVYAQGPDTPFEPDYDPDVPIDGGASLLVAAGVAYGLKKIYDKRKQDNNGEDFN